MWSSKTPGCCPVGPAQVELYASWKEWTYIYIQNQICLFVKDKCVNQTQKNEYKTYNVTAGLHVLTLTELSQGPHDTDPNKECPRHGGIPNAYNICTKAHHYTNIS